MKKLTNIGGIMIKLWLKQRCLDKVEKLPCPCGSPKCEGRLIKPEVKALWLSWEVDLALALKMAFWYSPQQVEKIIANNYTGYLEQKEFEKSLDDFFNDDDDLPSEG